MAPWRTEHATRAVAKAARRASQPKPNGRPNNKGSLFPPKTIPLVERRFLLDAVDALKESGKHKSDEAAGEAVHARLVAKDPLFARRFCNGNSKWYSRCNWRQAQKAADKRDLAALMARRKMPKGNALDIVITTFLTELAQRKPLFSIATACNYTDNNAKPKGAAMGIPDRHLDEIRRRCHRSPL